MADDTEHTFGDCRTPDGVTVSLIDGVIATCRVLRERNLATPAVLAALADLRQNEDVRATLQGDQPTRAALDDGPAAGHQFHFAVRVQGSSAVVGGPHVDDGQPAEDPFQVTVRAWNLRDACRAAAEIPLGQWSLDGKNKLADLDENGDPPKVNDRG